MLCIECAAPVTAVRCTVDPRERAHRFTAGCGHPLDRDAAARAWAAGLRWHVPAIDGAALIAAERERHGTEEGHSAATDAAHTGNELPWAAWCLLDAAASDAVDDAGPPPAWPLPADRWPGGKDQLRLLIIAGSFVAAEIDRRLREKGEH